MMRVLIETKRLVLRRFTEVDADALLDLHGDSEVMRFLTGGEPTPREVILSETLLRFLSYGGPKDASPFEWLHYTVRIHERLKVWRKMAGAWPSPSSQS